MNITAKELSGMHLTKRITVPFEGQQITGQLIDLHHGADMIIGFKLCDSEADRSLGRQWVSIEIAGNFEGGEIISTRLQPDTPITIQEG